VAFFHHLSTFSSLLSSTSQKKCFFDKFSLPCFKEIYPFLSHDRVSRKCGLLSSLINILKPVIKYFFRKNAFLIILVTVFLGNKALSYLINISSLLASISSGKMLFWLILIDRVLWKSGLLSSLVNILKPVIKYFFRKSAF
jgi:spore maturation protein SpmA